MIKLYSLCEWLIREGLKPIAVSLREYLSISSIRWNKILEKSDNISGLRSEKRSRDLQNTKQDSCSLQGTETVGINVITLSIQHL
jgi:hypothetical protein